MADDDQVTDDGVLVFDLTPIEVKYRIGGADYVLREASGQEAGAYRDKVIAGTKLGLEGNPETVRGIPDSEFMLIALCLRDTEGKKVSDTVIRGWPNRVRRSLYNKAMDISEIGVDEEKEKKDKEKKNNDAVKNE